MTEASKDDVWAAARATVETFGSIVGRPLILRSGKKARTENSEIVVPQKDSDPYLLVERQLAHILFRSNSKAREKFVKEFIERTVRAAYREGLPAVDFEDMQPALERVIDILESRRIESLWALLYPGSHAKSRERLKADTWALVATADDSLLNLFVCLDAGHEVEVSVFQKFLPIFREALRRVERRGFDATLIVARWLISKLVEQVREHTPQPLPEEGFRDRMEALRDVSTMFGKLPEDIEERYSDYELGENDNTHAQAMRLDLREEGALEQALAQSEDGMRSFMEEVQSRIDASIQKKDEREARGVRLDLLRIRSNEKALSPSPMRPEDFETAERLRRIFARIRAKQERSREDAGTEIDIEALIERRLSGSPVPCFKAERSGRGFRALVLVDRSKSMEGKRTEQAERGAMTLMKALQLPSTEVLVWGFQSYEKGDVVLTQFSSQTDSFDTEYSLPVDGFTPLHIAIEAAVDRLLPGSDSKHLLILTDGGPMFFDTHGREVSETQLRSDVRAQVRRAQRNGIHVTTFIIGGRTKEGALAFDVPEKHAYFMFGNPRDWRFVEEDNLGADMIRTVTTSFATYLSRG